jgi:chromodomain-helicase-DNA-binding protein 4
MAPVIRIADSDESNNDDTVHTPERRTIDREPSQPHSTLSHRFRESPQKEREKSGSADSIAVMVPPPARPWEYRPYRGDTTVDSVKAEVCRPNGQQEYKIEYEDGKMDIVSSHFFLESET